jgi:hypothetical protein
MRAHAGGRRARVEQDRDGLRILVAGHDVRQAVAVQVGCLERDREQGDGPLQSLREAAGALPENLDAVVRAVRDHQVRPAVAVHVRDVHVGDASVGRVPRRRAVAGRPRCAARPDQHGHALGGGQVGGHEVLPAVAVQVGDLDPVDGGRRLVRRRRSERAEAAARVAEQYRDPLLGRHRQVVPAVVVQVADRDRVRERAGVVGRRRQEAAVLLLEEHPDVVRAPVHQGEVWPPVAVQIPDGRGERPGAGFGIRRRRAEGAAAVAVEDADRRREGRRGGHVATAVEVDVPDRDLAELGPERVPRRRLQRAAGPRQQHGDVVGGDVARHDVGAAVAVQVAERERLDARAAGVVVDRRPQRERAVGGWRGGQRAGEGEREKG